LALLFDLSQCSKFRRSDHFSKKQMSCQLFLSTKPIAMIQHKIGKCFISYDPKYKWWGGLVGEHTSCLHQKNNTEDDNPEDGWKSTHRLFDPSLFTKETSVLTYIFVSLIPSVSLCNCNTAHVIVLQIKHYTSFYWIFYVAFYLISIINDIFSYYLFYLMQH
jgi:hypothetical protein